jgi:hypothetical protein
MEMGRHRRWRGAGRRGGRHTRGVADRFDLVSWRSAELERLNTEIAQSEARLEELNRRGGKIELTDCGGRLCAYASTNQGENYKDWKAPWSGREGLPLVILRGY